MRFIPDNNTEMKNEKANAVVYIYTSLKDKPCAVGYSGSRKKCDFHFNFGSEERREEYITKYFQDKINILAQREEEKQNIKNRKIELASKVEVGSIFSYSWGYEQTQCDFFQVVEKKGMKLLIREICFETVETVSSMSEYIRPVKDAFIKNSEIITKMITPYGINMNHGSASLVVASDKKFYRSWYY